MNVQAGGVVGGVRGVGGVRRRARTGLVGLLATAALGLSGCGVAGTDWRPGLAAEVGDSTLSSGTVDDYATDFCSLLDAGALGPDVGVIPRSELRAGIAGNLVRKIAAERFAAEYGAEPSTYYERTRNDVADGFPDATDSERESIVDVQTADVYVNEVAAAVGESTLVREGTAEPSPDEALQRGQEVFADWLASQEIDIDPSLGVTLAEDGTWVAEDSSTSVASTEAVVVAGGGPVDEAGAPRPEYTSYVASLPDSQKCGVASPVGG